MDIFMTLWKCEWAMIARFVGLTIENWIGKTKYLLLIPSHRQKRRIHTMELMQRINLVSGLTASIEESLKSYTAVERPCPGYNIKPEDSKTSIARRCRAARQELLRIIRDVEGDA